MTITADTASERAYLPKTELIAYFGAFRPPISGLYDR
jgi:hypothetical protein